MPTTRTYKTYYNKLEKAEAEGPAVSSSPENAEILEKVSRQCVDRSRARSLSSSVCLETLDGTEELAGQLSVPRLPVCWYLSPARRSAAPCAAWAKGAGASAMCY